jgi:DNA-binding XRE family transcriptional regulator
MMTKKHGKPSRLEVELNEWMKDPEFRKGFGEGGLKLELSLEIIRIRKARKMTQAQLGKSIGMNQSAIARIESGTMNLTALTLHRVAAALGTRLIIRFE